MNKHLYKTGSVLLALLLTPAIFAGCTKNAGTASSSPSVPSSAAGLATLDFATVMTRFNGAAKSADWDRTNVVKTDTTTTATVDVAKSDPSGSKPVLMLKGDPGKLTATSTSSGTLQTDPAVNSYYASAVLQKNGSPAQYGDGIYKFKEKILSPQTGQWNSAVIFKDSAPQEILSSGSLKKALAIVTSGGYVQIQRNYESGGKVVKQDVVKDTGINIGDSKYHYFIFAMKDVSSGTDVKLWVDGKQAYSGVVTGVKGTGAIQVFNNSTPMYDAAKKILITSGVASGSFAPVTACTETYFGGYDDGPNVANITVG